MKQYNGGMRSTGRLECRQRLAGEAGLVVCKSTGPAGFEHLGARKPLLPAFHAVSCCLLIYDRWPPSTAIFPSTRRRCILGEGCRGGSGSLARSLAHGRPDIFARIERFKRPRGHEESYEYIYICRRAGNLFLRGWSWRLIDSFGWEFGWVDNQRVLLGIFIQEEGEFIIRAFRSFQKKFLISIL